MSDSLRPHELQHARPPCPSPTPGVHSHSGPSSRWCHPAISSSLVPFSCPQFLPASVSFPVSQLFAWDGQSTGVSALASFPPEKSQGWSPAEWTAWISLQSKGLSRVFSNTTVQNHQFFSAQLSLQSNSHIHTSLLEKNIPLTRWTFVGKVMSLLSSWAISNAERWCYESSALNMPGNMENSAVATGLEKVSVHSNPKERQCQRMIMLRDNIWWPLFL